MKPKLQTIAGIILLALLSASAGYFVGTTETDSSPETAPWEKTPHRPSPLTKHGKKGPLDSKDNITTPDFSHASPDILLSRYSRLTPEQIGEEVARLNNLYPDLLCNREKKQYFALVYLLKRWGQLAPRQALAQLKTMNMDFASHAKTHILQAWAEKRPEEAFAYFAGHRGDIRQNEHLLQNIAKKMADTSPENALKWADRLTAEERVVALPALLNGIAVSYPELLKDFIGKLTPEDLTSADLRKSIAETWAISDWEAATQWVDGLSGKKNELRRILFGRLAAADPEKTSEEFKKLNDRARSAVIADVWDGMAQRNPVRALQWLTENTSEDMAANAVGGIIGSPIDYKTSGLTEYVADMPASPVKDSLLDAMIEQVSRDSYDSFLDFREPLSLAEGIKDPEKRANGIRKILNIWSDQDPKEAKV